MNLTELLVPTYRNMLRVDVGKRDYLPHMFQYLRQPAAAI